MEAQPEAADIQPKEEIDPGTKEPTNISEVSALVNFEQSAYVFYTIFQIEGVLLQTQERFQTMSNQILRRIDDMSKRVDDLEKNISDLMAEAGVNFQPTNTSD
jgi:hypothetical protein